MTTAWIVTLVVACAVILPVGAQLNITCYPNNTLVVENPDPAVYVGGYANDTNSICTMTFSEDNAFVSVSGCSKDDDILLHLTNATTVGVVLGGAGSILYIVRCNELVSDGVQQTLVQKFTPHLQSTVEPSATPTMPIHSRMRLANYTGTVVTTAMVGDELVWTLEIPVEYTADIQTCTAYAGEVVSDSVSKKVIISGSCSADTDITGDFAAATPVVIGNGLRYYTTVYAFKFYTSHFVTFSCDVKLCPSHGSSNCVMQACISGRRRRDVLPAADDSDSVYGLSETTYMVMPEEGLVFPNGAQRTYGPPVLQMLSVLLIFHYVLA